MLAKDTLYHGTEWIAIKARAAFPILLMLAKSVRKLTYQELDKEIATQNNLTPTPMVVSYGKVLEIIGLAINQLSQEWQEEIPPLTILIVNGTTGMPGAGVDGFLKRYIAKSSTENLSSYNRKAMIERATNAVHDYSHWDDVAAYFGINVSNEISETEPILLAKPSPVMGGESDAHLALKNYVAKHPELFKPFGKFEKGSIEFRLDSGDEVDVLFQNAEQVLAVEIKTDAASPGELTRGIFQCVKYRAVLRAMYHISGQLNHVQTVLVTPKPLHLGHKNAAQRLKIKSQIVSITDKPTTTKVVHP